LRAQAGDWLTLDRWRRGVENYFLSELTEHTLADMSVRFKIFYKGPIDRFKQYKQEATTNDKRETRSQQNVKLRNQNLVALGIVPRTSGGPDGNGVESRLLSAGTGDGRSDGDDSSVDKGSRRLADSSSGKVLRFG
jgi:hypothetical protein